MRTSPAPGISQDSLQRLWRLMVVVVALAAAAVTISLSASDEVRIPFALLLTLLIFIASLVAIYRYRPRPTTPPHPGPAAGQTPLAALESNEGLSPVRRVELLDLARRHTASLIIQVGFWSGQAALWSGLAGSPLWVRASLCPLAVVGTAYALYRTHHDRLRIAHHSRALPDIPSPTNTDDPSARPG